MSLPGICLYTAKKWKICKVNENNVEKSFAAALFNVVKNIAQYIVEFH